MDGHHLDGSPDRELGDVLRRAVTVPPPRPDLLAGLEPKLSEADAETPAPAAGGLVSFARRRRAVLVAAAAAAAAALVAIGLFGLPGLGGTSPQQATAADRMVEAIDAGLARVNTLQGTLVLSPPADAGANGHITSVEFAATGGGERWFDVTYQPDYASRQKEWKQALTVGKAPNETSASLARSADFLEANSALVRQVIVADSAFGTTSWKYWAVNPFTRKVVGVHYRAIAGVSDPDLFAKEIPLVWSLSTELRTALATQQPEIRVSVVSLRGKPTYRVVIYGKDGRPAYLAMVDRQYGVTLSVRQVSQRTANLGIRVTPFRIVRLRVNQPVDSRLFVMKPDYSHDPSGFGPRRASDTPAAYTIDFGGRAFPLDELSRHMSSYTLLPTWVPSGFSLVQAAHSPGDAYVWLTYRRGMDELRVGTVASNSRLALEGLSRGFVFSGSTASEDEPYMWSMLGVPVRRASSGAAAGWPMAPVLYDEPGRTAIDTLTGGVSGTAQRAVLQRMFDSLHPVKSGRHMPGDRFDAAAWALFAVIAAGTVVGAALVTRRRRVAGRASVPRAARLPLVGVAAVLLGAALPWHQMYGAGGDFGVRGWSDPVGVLTASLAILAGLAVWIVAGALPQRRSFSGRLLATLLGLAACACTALGLVYLPMRARFVSELNGDLRLTSLSSIGTYLKGSACPAPGPGLYLAIAGAVLIVVGALRLRSDRATIGPPG
jgi:hypothetical protein